MPIVGLWYRILPKQNKTKNKNKKQKTLQIKFDSFSKNSLILKAVYTGDFSGDFACELLAIQIAAESRLKSPVNHQ